MAVMARDGDVLPAGQQRPLPRHRRHYFWIDLAVAPAIAMLLAAVATRQPAPLVRLLTTRPVRSLGTRRFADTAALRPIREALRSIHPAFQHDPEETA